MPVGVNLVSSYVIATSIPMKPSAFVTWTGTATSMPGPTWVSAGTEISPQVPMPVQTPPAQASLELQGLPSSHPAPSGLAGSLQSPVPESHVPTSWHWSEAVQTTGLPPAQLPPWQASVWVQASSSSQPVPSGWCASAGQDGVDPSQLSAGSQNPVEARHSVPPLPAGWVQEPAPQTSIVQMLLSAVQAEPSAWWFCWQAPEPLQVSASSQSDVKE